MSCINLPADQQGCINITLVQGDNNRVRLEFEGLVLSDFDIVMDVKKQDNVSLSPLVQKTPGDGLIVESNDLIIEFKQEFFGLYQRVLYYDLAFTHRTTGEVMHPIKGEINIVPVTTKP